MSYFAMVTFDLNNVADSMHGNSAYIKIKESLAELDFDKYVIGRKEREVKLPANTFVAEFDVDEFEKSGELSEYLKNEIKEIFQKLNLKGKFFVTVGKGWAWSVGSI